MAHMAPAIPTGPAALHTPPGIPGGGAAVETSAGGGQSNASTQDKVPEGVILPPPDVREIISKTAGFVSRNGPAFEERIRANESGNAKFAFLQPEDPYNAYYVWQLKQAQQGVPVGAASAAPARPVTSVDSVAGPTGPEKPADFLFSDRLPAISAQDLDVLRLTAQFTAVKGRSFAALLSQREARNFQYDFLKPVSSLHAYFNAMVRQYEQLLQGKVPPREDDVMDRARVRARWLQHTAAEARQAQEQSVVEAREFARIDWHDYVVVETVVFTEADARNANIPPPTRLVDLQTATLEQKFTYADAKYAIQEAPPDFEPRGSDDSPRHAKRFRTDAATVRCPNCNQLFPASEIDEHIRIELLDPRAREQRAQLAARQQASNLSSSDVSDNIRRLASSRRDIFDQ